MLLKVWAWMLLEASDKSAPPSAVAEASLPEPSAAGAQAPPNEGSRQPVSHPAHTRLEQGEDATHLSTAAVGDSGGCSKQDESHKGKVEGRPEKQQAVSGADATASPALAASDPAPEPRSARSASACTPPAAEIKTPAAEDASHGHEQPQQAAAVQMHETGAHASHAQDAPSREASPANPTCTEDAEQQWRYGRRRARMQQARLPHKPSTHSPPLAQPIESATATEKAQAAQQQLAVQQVTTCQAQPAHADMATADLHACDTAQPNGLSVATATVSQLQPKRTGKGPTSVRTGDEKRRGNPHACAPGVLSVEQDGVQNGCDESRSESTMSTPDGAKRLRSARVKESVRTMHLVCASASFTEVFFFGRTR
jgi:hypothetical protein